ncbi:hypothetical protein SUDANB121_04899 [Nocardiopsis dassonvillei]|uniref:hypothetical protein n=1 Tax=Nocardiopsis dassonvillei TaxID=2014 RepID=UPI003F545BA9
MNAHETATEPTGAPAAGTGHGGAGAGEGGWRRAGRFLLARWPTALALLAAAATAGGGGSEDPAHTFADILPLLPLVYLVMAKVGERYRYLTWPLVLASFAAVTGLGATGLAAPSTVFTGLALLVLVWSVLDGHLFRSGTLRLQALGMLVFGGLGLLGLAVDPELARYLVAAGWFLHGAWDFYHLWKDRVVSRSFAEWCGVVDLWVAAELVLRF